MHDGSSNRGIILKRLRNQTSDDRDTTQWLAICFLPSNLKHFLTNETNSMSVTCLWRHSQQLPHVNRNSTNRKSYFSFLHAYFDFFSVKTLFYVFFPGNLTAEIKREKKSESRHLTLLMALYISGNCLASVKIEFHFYATILVLFEIHSIRSVEL